MKESVLITVKSWTFTETMKAADEETRGNRAKADWKADVQMNLEPFSFQSAGRLLFVRSWPQIDGTSQPNLCSSLIFLGVGKPWTALEPFPHPLTHRQKKLHGQGTWERIWRTDISSYWWSGLPPAAKNYNKPSGQIKAVFSLLVSSIGTCQYCSGRR